MDRLPPLDPDHAIPDKPTLRRLALARRAALTQAERQHAAMAVSDRLMAFVSTRPKAIVAGYWPIRDELDPRPAMLALEQEGFSLALPRIAGKHLRFCAYRTGDRLVDGPFKTLEPDHQAAEVSPSILLVPLVAFDHDCHRLGYGAGFYDRLLASTGHSPPLAIGLAYEAQCVARLPVEAHDQPLDLIISESDLRHRKV